MFVHKLSRSYTVVVLAICIIVAALISVMTYQITANAESVSWVADGELKLVDNSERAMNLQPQNCREQTVLINDRPGISYYDSGFTSACVYDLGSWRYALTNQTYRRWPMNQQDVSFALSVGVDAKMYRVNNLHPQDIPVYVPGSKSLVYANEGVGWGRKLKIYKDIVQRLQKVNTDTYTVNNVDSPDFAFKRPNGNVLPVGKVTSSSNGKWLVFEAIDLGIMRLNLETYEVKRISSVAPQYGLFATPHMSLAISDNGDYVAIAGENTPFIIYNVTPECGDDFVTDDMTKYISMVNPCPLRDVGQYLETVLPSGLAAATSLRLSSDAGEIGFMARLNSDRYGQNQKEYVAQAPGYVPGSRLDYLAMGDSYSSGEGDTQVMKGKKYYLSGTDVDGTANTPREKCHISSRSYPFILKNMMGISDAGMKSVACSGAVINRDYLNQDQVNYLGQESRLDILSPESRSQYKNISLKNFTPGRLQQSSFIEMYKPGVITITGGGNDVGFGDVIANCVFGFVTCSEAQTLEGRARIGQAIESQHAQLFDMFNKMKLESPKSKIYVIGYPQFINDKSLFCAPNVQLEMSERKLIVESVKFLNKIIKEAAINAGVKYVDIEDSLNGHKLCEAGKSFVTGIALAGTSERQESFHPNQDGHRLIASAITKALGGESLLQFNDQLGQTNPKNPYTVETPSYFKQATDYVTRYLRGQLIDKSFIKKNNTFTLTFNNLKPNSKAAIELRSSPINLGEYDVDNQGRLVVDIVTPDNITPGFHTLHLIGESYSGEAIDIWQGIEVRGTDGDIDEDGVPDNIDQCAYVTQVDMDIDNDKVDDACDPSIDNEEKDTEGQSNIGLLIVDANLRQTDVKSEINSTPYMSSDTTRSQTQIKDLFYLPVQEFRKYSKPKDSTHVSMAFAIASALLSLLILKWAIKRYSDHSDM